MSEHKFKVGDIVKYPSASSKAGKLRITGLRSLRYEVPAYDWIRLNDNETGWDYESDLVLAQTIFHKGDVVKLNSELTVDYTRDDGNVVINNSGSTEVFYTLPAEDLVLVRKAAEPKLPGEIWVTEDEEEVVILLNDAYRYMNSDKQQYILIPVFADLWTRP